MRFEMLLNFRSVLKIRNQSVESTAARFVIFPADKSLFKFGKTLKKLF